MHAIINISPFRYSFVGYSIQFVLLSELLSKQIKLTHISKPKPTQTKPSNIAPRSKSAKPVNLLFYFLLVTPHTSFYNCAVLEFSKFTPPITSFFPKLPAQV